MCGITSPQVLRTGQVHHLDRLHIYLTSKIRSHPQVQEQALSHRWKEKIQCGVVLCYLAKPRMESLFIKHCTPVGFHTLPCLIRDTRNSKGVFRCQALAHLSETYRNVQIPDSDDALCRHCLCSVSLPAKIPRQWPMKKN